MHPHPVLYQLNTRVYLNALSQQLGRHAKLDDIPDKFLTQLADHGIQIVWLLSVWTTGPRSLQESRRNPEWLDEFSRVLGDLQTDDIGGSGFAIADYRVSEQLGGPKSLEKLRSRLSKLGIKLMLDFVPNHMGLDHPWLNSNPEYLIEGTQELLDE
ncbi:MAG: alpha-amylase family glycosyl hydrolase, partial [Pirellula sp.]